MSHPPIITLPHESLRKKSTKVIVVDNNLKQIVRDMEQATLEWEDSRDHEVGVALAAVQINNPKRIVIIRNNFEDKTDRTFKLFINPEITKYEGEVVEDYEGCLSIKDIYGKVPRYSKVRVKALNADGQEVRVKADGFLARVFQHEIDHTKGMVFVDHIKDKPEAFYTLTEQGNLEKLDYEKISKDKKLWS